MTEFLLGFVARAVVMVPTIMIVSSLAWWAYSRFGPRVPRRAFEPRDMRTWPLVYALAEGSLFALLFAAIAAALGESEWAVPVAAGFAAAVTIGIAPALLVRAR